MPRFVLFLLLLTGLLFVAPPAPTLVRAEDKPKAKAVKKPIGTWTREAGGWTITFEIKDGEMTIKLKDGDGNTIDFEAEYGVTKGGTLYGCATKVTTKGIDTTAEKGDLFSVVYSANDKELTVSDLKGTHVNDEARKLIEGVYKKQ
jgi:hypothetical protein